MACKTCGAVMGWCDMGGCPQRAPRRVKEKREIEREELLRSAHAIALRKGENTAWDRFAASLAKAGIGSVTARTYRILPSDVESANG